MVLVKKNSYVRKMCKISHKMYIICVILHLHPCFSGRLDQPSHKYRFIEFFCFAELSHKHPVNPVLIFKDIEVQGSLSLGILPQVVMKWTGHSDYKAMKPDFDIA